MPSLSDCWLWKGAKTKAGYGVIRQDGKNYYIHRLMLEAKIGRVLTTLEWSLHRCDVPVCWNPDHLFLGNQRINIQDMHAKGRHCKSPKPAKLTDAQVLEIRARKGQEYACIAADFGVTPQYIGQLLRGEWRKYAVIG